MNVGRLLVILFDYSAPTLNLTRNALILYGYFGGRTPAFSRRDAPELCQPIALKGGRRECRMQAAPASLACKKTHTLRTQAKTGQPKQPALPAQWCYGLYAPSPVSGLFSHRRPADLGVSPVRATSPNTRLDPSVGRSGPRDFAVRIARASSRAPTRPSQSRTNVRDDASAPLRERGMAQLNHEFRKYGSAIFLPDGLDISRAMFR